MSRSGTGTASIISDLRMLPKPVYLLCVTVATYRAVSFIQFFIVLYGVQIGLGAARSGVLLTAYGAVSVVGVSVADRLINRIGPHRAMGLTMVCSGVLVGFVPFIHTFGLLLAACAASGLTSQVYRPSALTLVASLARADVLVTASAAFRLAINFGTGVGPVIGAGLLLWSPLALFEVGAATSIVVGVIVLVALSSPDREPAVSPAGARAGGLRAAIADRRYLLFVTSVLLTALTEVQLTALLPLTVRQHHLPPVFYGLLLSLNAVLIIVVELPLTGYVKRLSIRTAVAGGTAVMAAGVFVFGLAIGIPLLLLAMVIWTFGEMACSPSLLAYPAIAAPQRLRSGYITLLWTCQGIGYAVGPVFGTALFAIINAWVWFCLAGACVAAVASAWLGIRATVDATTS